MVAQPGKGTITKSNTMAYARTSLDGRDARQESQHGAFLATSLGLEGLRTGAKLSLKWSWLYCFHYERTLIMRHENVAGMSKWSGATSGR